MQNVKCDVAELVTIPGGVERLATRQRGLGRAGASSESSQIPLRSQPKGKTGDPRFAFCILHFAFCILHFAFCILHFAFCAATTMRSGAPPKLERIVMPARARITP
jgi:hypothetical protein